MKPIISYISVIIMISFILGCKDTGQKQKERQVVSSDPKINSDIVLIKPGFYDTGPEYERVSKTLESANASISLDYHQGIEWYDEKRKSWEKIASVEDLQPLLNAVSNKNIITISTGKATWDKENEYINTILKYAKSCGYQFTIVTNANAQGTIVSKVVQHKK